MVHDRVQTSELNITHDFLSQMLGTRRSSVTLAAGVLHRAGAMEYRRSRIHILDCEGLAGMACECYGIVKQSWDRMRSSNIQGRYSADLPTTT